jgi:hypothetical protein
MIPLLDATIDDLREPGTSGSNPLAGVHRVERLGLCYDP